MQYIHAVPDLDAARPAVGRKAPAESIQNLPTFTDPIVLISDLAPELMAPVDAELPDCRSSDIFEGDRTERPVEVMARLSFIGQLLHASEILRTNSDIKTIVPEKPRLAVVSCFTPPSLGLSDDIERQRFGDDLLSNKLHTMGYAADVALIAADGQRMDMGYVASKPRTAHPDYYEDYRLNREEMARTSVIPNTAELRPAQAAVYRLRRRVLYTVMRAAGLQVDPTRYWHYGPQKLQSNNR